MRSNFEEKRANRQERYERLAAKFKNESESRYARFQSIASFIPMGQPILVGHHSEKRHRRDIEKMHNNMSASVEANRKSAYYAGKAATIDENTAISSDDPDALEKLTIKLQKLEKIRDFMKAANKCIKAKDIEKFLQLEGATEAIWTKLNTPDYVGCLGFRSFELTNRGATIRTVKERIAKLQKLNTLQDEEKQIGDVKILHNASENRVQIFFPGKPSDEVRSKLKSYGFRWSPTSMAWQAFYSNRAKWAAEQIVTAIQC